MTHPRSSHYRAGIQTHTGGWGFLTLFFPPQCPGVGFTAKARAPLCTASNICEGDGSSTRVFTCPLLCLSSILGSRSKGTERCVLRLTVPGCLWSTLDTTMMLCHPYKLETKFWFNPDVRTPCFLDHRACSPHLRHSLASRYQSHSVPPLLTVLPSPAHSREENRTQCGEPVLDSPIS